MPSTTVPSVTVNFMFQLDGPQGAQVFGPTFPWVCLGASFGVGLTCEWVD